MSRIATNWAWASIRKQQPTMKAALVLLALADCHNEETGRCDPSVTYLSEKVGMSERSVRNALRELEKSKLISTTFRQQSTGRGRRNLTSKYALKGGAQFAAGMGHSLPTKREYYARAVPSRWHDLSTGDDCEVIAFDRGASHA